MRYPKGKAVAVCDTCKVIMPLDVTKRGHCDCGPGEQKVRLTVIYNGTVRKPEDG